jgi:DNA processing protein
VPPLATLPDLLDPRDPQPEVQRALREWLGLQAVGALRPRECAELLASSESPRAAERALRAHGAEGACLDPERDLARLARLGARALPLGSPVYPGRLARLEDPPPLLWVIGDPGALLLRGVAVVGPRAATAYGRRVARELGAGLAGEGLVVISGLARGVDGEAHRAALEAGGLTVAVQGRGADDVYPGAHRSLAREIAAHGAVISELPPGAPPLGMHFPLRNRLIAALAECVVVVEARARSGSLSTARHALDQGGDVLAVPGPLTSPTSQGTNRLLAQGAAPYLDLDDVRQSLGLPLPRVAERGREAEMPESRLVSALRHEPATSDELARRLGCAPETLSEDLLELELQGIVARDRDGCLRVLVAAGTRAPKTARTQPLSSGSRRGGGRIR